MVTMQDIFVFKKTGVGEKGQTLGQYMATGIRPKFTERLASMGIRLPVEMFQSTGVY